MPRPFPLPFPFFRGFPEKSAGPVIPPPPPKQLLYSSLPFIPVLISFVLCLFALILIFQLLVVSRETFYLGFCRTSTSCLFGKFYFIAKASIKTKARSNNSYLQNAPLTNLQSYKILRNEHHHRKVLINDL